MKFIKRMWKYFGTFVRLVFKLIFQKLEDLCSFRNTLVISYLGFSMYIKYLAVIKVHPSAATIITALSICDGAIFAYYLHTRSKAQINGSSNIANETEFPEKEEDFD